MFLHSGHDSPFCKNSSTPKRSPFPMGQKSPFPCQPWDQTKTAQCTLLMPCCWKSLIFSFFPYRYEKEKRNPTKAAACPALAAPRFLLNAVNQTLVV